MKTLPRFQLDEMITLAKQVIKTKRNQIGKSDTSAKGTEKRLLKQLETAFEDTRLLIYIEDEDTRAYFDILQVLLNDDRNYEYIKKLKYIIFYVLYFYNTFFFLSFRKIICHIFLNLFLHMIGRS